MPASCSHRLRILPAALVVLSLLGCSPDKTPLPSQVAVKVNDGEISVHQVQAVLRNRPIAGASENAAANVLEVLVDQELAAQAATSAGLHKDPNVIQAAELQRREVLARAYYDRIAGGAAGPSSNDVDRYYDAHPALFAQRRLYLISETAVAGDADDIAALNAAVSQVRGPAELKAALERLQLDSSARQYAQAAEDVPISLLPAFAAAKPGDSIVVAHSGGARIFTMLYVHLAPVDRRTATPAIAKFLLAERQRRLVGDAMAELRKGAQLQYSTAIAARATPTAPAASAPAVGASQRDAR